MNQDGIVNILDIVNLVNIILSPWIISKKYSKNNSIKKWH
jgi:hypothetical protein